VRNVVKDLTAEISEKVSLTVVEQEYVRSSDVGHSTHHADLIQLVGPWVEEPLGGLK
jgi:hypothetical protein